MISGTGRGVCQALLPFPVASPFLASSCSSLAMTQLASAGFCRSTIALPVQATSKGAETRGVRRRSGRRGIARTDCLNALSRSKIVRQLSQPRLALPERWHTGCTGIDRRGNCLRTRHAHRDTMEHCCNKALCSDSPSKRRTPRWTGLWYMSLGRSFGATSGIQISDLSALSCVGADRSGVLPHQSHVGGLLS